MSKSLKYYFFIAVLSLIGPVNIHSQHKFAISGNRMVATPILTEAAPGYSLQEEKYDVNFYFIDLEVSNLNAFVKGSTTINSTRIATEVDTFVVEISRYLLVDSVYFQETKENHFLQQGDLLKVIIPELHKKSNHYSLRVFYHGNSGSQGFFAGISSVKAPYLNKNVTYTLSEPFQARDWFPCKQNLKDKADSAWVFITVNSGLKAGSNGILTAITDMGNGKSRYEWKTNYPIDYYLLSLSVGDYYEYSFYAMLNATDSVLVQNYIYNSPSNIEKVIPQLDETAPLLRLFSEKFGKYPFAEEKYGHSQAPMGGGMEHQTMTTMSSFDFGILSHELAHQWFGDFITCGTWQDIWINEGFASYAEYVAIEGLKSRAEAISWLDQAHNYAINYPADGVFLSPAESRDVDRIFNYGLTYRKGGSIIHMLRYEINDDSLFFDILREFVIVHGNSTATGNEFAQVVKAKTGKDYDWFFDQWYFGKGHPVFVTNWRQIGDSLIIVSSQSSSDGLAAFFKTHLDFRIHYEDGMTEDIRVLYDSMEEVFTIPCPKAVKFVQSDPNSNVLQNTVIYKFTDPIRVFSANPNPFKHELNISFRNNNKIREIRLSDINGKIILEQETTNAFLNIDLSFLRTGIYLLYVTEDSVKYTEKIIKQ